MNLKDIVNYVDDILDIRAIKDVSLNGLQVQNSGMIHNLCAAVDISSELINKCPNNTLILVHHGLFWAKPVRIIKSNYDIIKLLFEKDSALYAAHLPLDINENYGNNCGFYKLLQWDLYKSEKFGLYKDIYLSYKIDLPASFELSYIMEEIEKVLGKNLLVWPFGKNKIKHLAFVSGGAAELISEAVDKSLDLFITGEPQHQYYWYAKENKINVVFAGHYNTETIGVKVLAKHLSVKFGLNYKFIDLPTGL